MTDTRADLREQATATQLPATRAYCLRLRIEYRSGQALEAEAETYDDLADLINTGIKVLWPNTAKPLTIDEMTDWLGWDKR